MRRTFKIVSVVAYVIFATCFAAAFAALSKTGQDQRRGIVITTKNGIVMEGLLSSEDDKSVTLEVDDGTTGIPREHIASISYINNKYVLYQEKEAAVTASGSASDHWLLADWSLSQGMLHFARKNARAVIALSPDHRKARRLLGYERIKGAWLTGPGLKRAKGLIEFNGRWMSPDERDELRISAESKALNALSETRRLEALTRYENAKRRRIEAQTRHTQCSQPKVVFLQRHYHYRANLNSRPTLRIGQTR